MTVTRSRARKRPCIASGCIESQPAGGGPSPGTGRARAGDGDEYRDMLRAYRLAFSRPPTIGTASRNYLATTICNSVAATE